MTAVGATPPPGHQAAPGTLRPWRRLTRGLAKGEIREVARLHGDNDKSTAPIPQTLAVGDHADAHPPMLDAGMREATLPQLIAEMREASLPQLDAETQGADLRNAIA
jgi:hypothetical protein